MTLPTSKVVINFANQDATPDNVDVTSDVLRISTSRGRNIIQDLYEVGKATVVVLDPNGNFNPQNTSSPYYTKLVPLRGISISAVYNAVEYSIFTGFVIKFKYTYPRGQEVGYVTLECEDAFRLFNMSAVDSIPAATAGQDTGARIGAILDAISWPAALRDINTGLTTCQADPGGVRTALKVFRDVEFSEGLGAFYIAPNGNATFRNRNNTIIGYAPRSTRTQIIPNPSFEVGTLSWTQSGVTIARSSTAGSVFLSASNGRVPVDASSQYTISCYVFVPTGQPNITMRLRWTEFTAVTGGTQVGGTRLSSAQTITAGAGWTRFSRTFTTQAGVAAIATTRLENSTLSVTGQFYYIDGVMLEKASAVDVYFDGNTNLYDTKYAANSTWAGTVNRSDSNVSFLTYPDPTLFIQDGTGVDYQNISFALDDSLLVNDASMTRIGGTKQTFVNTTSVDTYFIHSINKDSLLIQTDDSVLQLAQAYVAGRQDTGIRIESVTLNLNAYSASTDIIAAIDLDFFDRVTVTNSQPGGSTISQTLFVQGVSHEITPDAWVTTFQTYESLLDGFVLNDDVKGVLDSNVLSY
jgi:hypothetical protein